MANKEQKRSSREAKKPKQKKKAAEKRSAGKAPAPKTSRRSPLGAPRLVTLEPANRSRWGDPNR